MQTPVGALAQSEITALMKHHSLMQQSPFTWHALLGVHCGLASPASSVAGTSAPEPPSVIAWPPVPAPPVPVMPAAPVTPPTPVAPPTPAALLPPEPVGVF